MVRPAILLCTLLIAGVASAETLTLLQAPSSASGTRLEIRDGRAWLARQNGQRLRLPLRRGETLEELVEFDGGWAAAGVRRRSGRRELVMVVDGAAGVERLRPMPEPVAALQVRPVPLASASGLEGLAWLEGDSPSAYEVRAADWSGVAWQPPQTVSAARSGGQAGLTGTVLEDGRALLVWSAADGGPSELLWSLRDGTAWSSPRRLAAANRRADITPTLLRVASGALVVWAQLGETGYRLLSSRFAGGGWSPPRPIGPPDASFPRFAEIVDQGRFVVLRAGGGWAALELDATGGELRRAAVAEPRTDRPALTARGGGLALRWQRAGATRALDWQALR